MTLKIQHKRSAVKAKAPQPTDLEYGEIAVNYEKSDPCIYIKDSANTIRRIGGHQPGVLVFKGAVAPTSKAPTSPVTGNVYIMNAAGVMAASWTGIAGQTVAQNENIAWSGTQWEPLGGHTNASETVAGIAEIATQAEVLAGTDDTPIVTPLKLAKAVPAASETAKGKVELATAAETKTGTDHTRAVHPAGLKPLLDLKLNLAGGHLTGGVTQKEHPITASAFNLATGNFWICGAIKIPNPTHAVAGMSGLIRLTAAPTGWGSHFSTAPTAKVFPSIVPFYVESATKIRLGAAVGVA